MIAGSLKGRRLRAPDWEGLRPTSDKLRETLFNVLAPRVVGARVLDVFAGTGALGIEALSRGAASVTFVERDPRAEALIVENLARCGIAGGYTILCAEAGSALERIAAAPAFVPFDIVLLDPPYSHRSEPRPGMESDAAQELLARAASVLGPRGLAVLEHSRRRPSLVRGGDLVRVREIHSGDSTLSFYEHI